MPSIKPAKFIVVTLLLSLLFVLLTACGDETPVEPTVPPTLDPTSTAGLGEKLFRTQCAACHSVAVDTMIVGPSLAGISSAAASRVADLNAEEYLSDSILYPDDYVVEGFEPGTMQQNFAATLTSEEVDNLVAYLLTLK